MSIMERIDALMVGLAVRYGHDRAPSHLLLGVKQIEEVAKECAYDRRFEFADRQFRMPTKFYFHGFALDVLGVPVPSMLDVAWSADDANHFNRLTTFWYEVKHRADSRLVCGDTSTGTGSGFTGD